jgi:predicted nuclease of predicted toxin-antitoxin system
MNQPPLYLDESVYWKALVRFLIQSGYEVHTPVESSLLRAGDVEHLEYAARNGYALVTKDPDDFRDLHNDWQAQGRSHAGILLICEEQDPRKNMNHHDVVRAIGNLLASGLPITNELHVLNHWR